MAPDPSLISVRTEVVLDTLVGAIHDRASSWSGPVHPSLSRVPEGDPAAAAVARHGYASRAAEAEMFERARGEVPMLADALAERLRAGADMADAIAAESAELAGNEPQERPSPGEEGAFTWRVPGPGGHVRHYVAERATGGRAELKAAWVYGFAVRCCEELEERLQLLG